MSAIVFFAGSAEVARLTNTFAVGGTATDPTTISLVVTTPSGSSTTYTFAGGDLTKVSTGIYRRDIACTEAGVWHYVWIGTGTASDVEVGTFSVLPTAPRIYATVDELKLRIGASATDKDAQIGEALATASREIDKWTRRQFHKTTTASSRVFRPDPDDYGVYITVDDFHTTTDLVIAVDYGDDGTFETTWSASDYELRPLNGIVDGETGWPYCEIAAVGARRFPTCSRRAAVQVTAQWGWSAVPPGVKEAALIVAADLFKLGDAPFGVAGYGDYGPVRIRENPVATRLLMPYRRDPILVG